jgi:serine/threonine-protein kinase
VNKTRFGQIEQLYLAALDKPTDERAAFVIAACGDDGELRREVESLLGHDSREDNFLNSSPEALAAEALAEIAEIDDDRSLESRQISHYMIQKLIGAGGMGEVYLAEDLRLQRRVALKVLPQSIVGDRARLLRFEREAQAASALNHPNILTVHEFGEDAGIYFIATEFVDGETLRDKLAAGPIPPAETLEITVQVASALSDAHEAGITHRDIKPENIMLRRDGYVKILDFGLAKISQANQPKQHSAVRPEDPTRALLRTEPGAVMGTDAYMSPEQARGTSIDARTDIWSLGVVIYEMLTEQRPFTGKTQADTIVAVLSSEPAPIRSRCPGLPPEFDWVISKSLSKDVEARYQTAKEFRADLLKLKRQIDTGANFDHSIPPSQINVGFASEARSTSTANSIGRGIHSTTEAEMKPTAVGAAIEETTASAPRRFPSFVIPALAAALVVVATVSAAFYFGLFTPMDDRKIDSIAVLPFENPGGNADLNFVADGISEALIDKLAQLPQLKVISRNSSFNFRGKAFDRREIAAKLGVRALVTGSVTQIGDELAIRVDVEDVVENVHLTGAQFRRKSADLANIQSEIAQTAVEQLRLKLTSAQSKRLAENSTDNAEAYRYYLNGLVELNGPQGETGNAIEHFERAVAIDPDFAAAHAEIAWVYYNRAQSGGDPGILMPKVKAATERTIALDPNFAKARVLQALLYEYEFDWRSAEQEYKRAIEFSPNLDFARNNYAFFLSVMGRNDEALAQLEEQRVRDPINQRLALLQKGIILVQARKFDEALQAYQEAQAVDKSKDVPDFALGYAYAGKGLYNEAVSHYKKVVRQLGGEDKYSQPLVYLAAAYAKMPGKQAEARALLKNIEDMPDYKSPALLAIVHSALGDNDKAMQLLENAYIKRDPLLRFIGAAYEYDGLRKDKRFVDLLNRIELG